MTEEELQFLAEANHLEVANKLADLAIVLFGDDAGLHLMGATLEAYCRTHGVEGMLGAVKKHLQSVLDNEGRPRRLAQ